MTPQEIRKQGKQLDKSDFDKLVREKKIKNPQIESFGDEYGEPYNPNRLIWGYLKKQLVYTETQSEPA